MKKVMVAVKRVVDYNARIRVKPDKVPEACMHQQGLAC